MKPVLFDGCAGWLHEAAGTLGVVLCNPHGHEAMWSHRAFRHLAGDLAAAGLPVLRFDYPGTGDSAGTDADGEHIAWCVHGILAAVATLREQAGVSRVVLCGLRLGATLAVLAAEALAAREPDAVAGLVLVAPVVSGRAYLRELRALHTSWVNNVIPDIELAPPTDGSLEVLAYRLQPDTVTTLEGLRLDRRKGCPAPRVLLLDAWPGATSPVAEMGTLYRGSGVEVTLGTFGEYPGMMQAAEYAQVPETAWLEIRTWLGLTLAEGRRPAGGPMPASAGMHEVHEREFGSARERCVWLDRGRQFGILCQPVRRAPNGVAVLFPNTGGNHHVGDGRLFVTLSRQLAEHGVTALRLDLSAQGDSPAPARQLSIPDVYAKDPCDDASAVVDWLRAQGYKHIVLCGVCSGAYISLQVALRNAAVNGLVLANLAKFRWDDADTASVNERAQSMRGYAAALRRVQIWQRLCRGQVKVWPILSGFVRRGYRRVSQRTAARIARWCGMQDTTTVTAFARAAMRELDGRGVRTDFLYGASDLGLEEAKDRFGGSLEALNGLSHIHVHSLSRFDHALFLADSRAALGAHLMTHLDALAIGGNIDEADAQRHGAPFELAGASPAR
ncbi:alpha/beta hydrolase [Cupriavidus sp. CV2]|uniref:alpha/beta fold hydrolase n=1 Tax=Cupriavidus ulmosensis TaxID=3065913 RepID=UPI00296ACE74|nr:alpha/beta fold hydrolase [Cupriavidus sp. CV2]MDW3681310.1 alpha/beta hydrolase [Cupriavidus sp. CV2]